MGNQEDRYRVKTATAGYGSMELAADDTAMSRGSIARRVKDGVLLAFGVTNTHMVRLRIEGFEAIVAPVEV